MVFVVQLIWRTFSILMGDHGFIFFFSRSLSLVILGYFLPVFACKNWSDLTPQSRAFSPSFYLNPQIRCDQMLNLLNSVERQKSDYSMQYLMPDQGERERNRTASIWALVLRRHIADEIGNMRKSALDCPGAYFSLLFWDEWDKLPSQIKLLP